MRCISTESVSFFVKIPYVAFRAFRIPFYSSWRSVVKDIGHSRLESNLISARNIGYEAVMYSLKIVIKFSKMIPNLTVLDLMATL